MIMQQQSSPVIASDNAGGAFIAWSDLRNLNDNNIFAQHVLASGVVDPLWHYFTGWTSGCPFSTT